jgi:hypothetical protein
MAIPMLAAIPHAAVACSTVQVSSLKTVDDVEKEHIPLLVKPSAAGLQ